MFRNLVLRWPRMGTHAAPAASQQTELTSKAPRFMTFALFWKGINVTSFRYGPPSTRFVQLLCYIRDVKQKLECCSNWLIPGRDVAWRTAMFPWHASSTAESGLIENCLLLETQSLNLCSLAYSLTNRGRIRTNTSFAQAPHNLKHSKEATRCD